VRRSTPATRSRDEAVRGRPQQRVLRPMSGSYLNKTITQLGQILDVADERGLIDRNPVRVNPARRKVKVSRGGATRASIDVDTCSGVGRKAGPAWLDRAPSGTGGSSGMTTMLLGDGS
jgi:hypothetical protein